MTGRRGVYGLTANGRYQVNRLMTRECPDIGDRGPLPMWFKWLMANGFSSYDQVGCWFR